MLGIQMGLRSLASALVSSEQQRRQERQADAAAAAACCRRAANGPPGATLSCPYLLVTRLLMNADSPSSTEEQTLPCQMPPHTARRVLHPLLRRWRRLDAPLPAPAGAKPCSCGRL